MKQACAFLKFILFVLFSFCTMPTYATTIDKIVVFGDSLSDNGNMFNLSNGKFPRKPPYFSGHFSNGITWVEYLAKALHFDTNSSTQFSDYAYAKAWASDLNDVDPLSYFTLSTEIDEYLSKESTHGAKEANHLFVIWIGNNDYLGGDKTLSLDEATNLTVSAIKDGIETLIKDGARIFLVLNITDLGVTPSSIAEGLEISKRLTRLSYMHNEKLVTMLKEERSHHPEIKIIEMNLMAYFEDMTKHPAKFKFKYIDKPCYDGDFGSMSDPDKKIAAIRNKIQLPAAYYALPHYEASQWHVCSNPNEYIYWDILHPTSYVHRILAAHAVKPWKVMICT